MPRVSIKKKEYKASDFVKWFVGELYERHITRKEVGEWFGVSGSAVSRKISDGNFDLKELLIIFEKLNTPADKIGELLKV